MTNRRHISVADFLNALFSHPCECKHELGAVTATIARKSPCFRNGIAVEIGPNNIHLTVAIGAMAELNKAGLKVGGKAPHFVRKSTNRHSAVIPIDEFEIMLSGVIQRKLGIEVEVNLKTLGDFADQFHMAA